MSATRTVLLVHYRGHGLTLEGVCERYFVDEVWEDGYPGEGGWCLILC